MPEVVNNQLHYALANGSQYIDVFKDLSALNRKLFPQGRVAFITDFSYTIWSAANGNGGHVQITALPNTWVVHNAYVKAKAHWEKQQKDTRRLIGRSAKPKWEDFKVYFDEAHRAGTELTVPSLSYGEWEHSKLVYDDGSLREPYCHVLGDDVGATDVGLVLNYQKSRATVQVAEPELPDNYSHNIYAYMAEAENDVADEIAQNMEYDNDQAPYDQDDYPGNDSNVSYGQSVKLVATPITNIHATSNSVMTVPCGLLRVEHIGIDQSDGTATTAPTLGYLNFKIAYGKFKGLAAPEMGQ